MMVGGTSEVRAKKSTGEERKVSETAAHMKTCKRNFWMVHEEMKAMKKAHRSDMDSFTRIFKNLQSTIDRIERVTGERLEKMQGEMKEARVDSWREQNEARLAELEEKVKEYIERRRGISLNLTN